MNNPRQISKKRYLDPNKNKIRGKNFTHYSKSSKKSSKQSIHKKIRDLKRLIEHVEKKGVTPRD